MRKLIRLPVGLSRSDTSGCPGSASMQESFQGQFRACRRDGEEGFVKVIEKENVLLLL